MLGRKGGSGDSLREVFGADESVQGRAAETLKAEGGRQTGSPRSSPGPCQARGFGGARTRPQGRDLIGSGSVPVDPHNLLRLEETALVAAHTVPGRQLDNAAGECRQQEERRMEEQSARPPLSVRPGRRPLWGCIPRAESKAAATREGHLFPRNAQCLMPH